MGVRTWTAGAAVLAAAAWLGVAGSVCAQVQSPPPAPDAPIATSSDVGEVVVFGRGEAKIGVAHAASEGTVSGADLLVRPLLRVAELLEAVPGMVAAQHSGSGKANQYFLRGFNLDHGSDFTTYIDGVQMNFRTHGHGQGYLDLNGLIPETIAREDYRKGPYRADGGDFALAGAAYMTTIAGFDRPWVSAEGGMYGYGRLAAGGTAHGVGGGDLTLVGQLKTYDGPWRQPEDLRHASGFAKWERPTGWGLLELSAHGYHGEWRPTEQIPERIVGSPVCPDVFCSPDPTATGRTDRVIVNAKLSGEGWRGALNAQVYDWDMYANPTYANPDGTSAQIHQFDRRWVLGLTAEKTWALSPDLALRVGTEERYDDIGRVGVVHTIDRAFVNSLGLYSVTEASAAAWGEATWTPVERLRLIGGLRADYYRAEVGARDPQAAAIGTGEADDAIVSPKLSAAYKLRDDLELYGNWGRGFHSNDVRGAVTSTPVPVLVPGTGYEAGARLQRGPFSVTATYWWLDVDSELKFVGDSNAVEPTGASARRGYELVAFWRPLPWLAIDASYVGSHARYDNGDHIPNAFESAGALGISAVGPRWEGSLRVRHLGPSPLIEDDSVRDPGSTVVNVRGAYKMKHVQIYAELLNLLDSRDKDIAYVYQSYIPSFDAAPTEGRLSRVVEPLTFRMGAKYTF